MLSISILLIILIVMTLGGHSDYEDLNRAVFEAQNIARVYPQYFADLAEYEIENKFVYDRNQNPTKTLWLEENFVPKSNRCYNQLSSFEGASAWQELVDNFSGFESKLEPLIWSEGLSQACYDHVQDIGPNSITGHTGSDFSSPFDRIDRYVTSNGAGENLGFSDAVNGEDVILQLLIDDGVSNRGHRKNIMNADFTHAGVSCGCHTYYTEVCCIAYGINAQDIKPSFKANVAPQLKTCKKYTPVTPGDTSDQFDLNDKYPVYDSYEPTNSSGFNESSSNNNDSETEFMIYGNDTNDLYPNLTSEGNSSYYNFSWYSPDSSEQYIYDDNDPYNFDDGTLLPEEFSGHLDQYSDPSSYGYTYYDPETNQYYYVYTYSSSDINQNNMDYMY